MYRDDLTGSGSDLFGFDVEGLPDLSQFILVHTSVPHDMRRDLHALTVCVGQDRRIEAVAIRSELNVKGAREKEC